MWEVSSSKNALRRFLPRTALRARGGEHITEVTAERRAHQRAPVVRQGRSTSARSSRLTAAVDDCVRSRPDGRTDIELRPLSLWEAADLVLNVRVAEEVDDAALGELILGFAAREPANNEDAVLQ